MIEEESSMDSLCLLKGNLLVLKKVFVTAFFCNCVFFLNLFWAGPCRFSILSFFEKGTNRAGEAGERKFQEYKSFLFPFLSFLLFASFLFPFFLFFFFSFFIAFFSCSIPFILALFPSLLFCSFLLSFLLRSSSLFL